VWMVAGRMNAPKCSCLFPLMERLSFCVQINLLTVSIHRAAVPPNEMPPRPLRHALKVRTVT